MTGGERDEPGTCCGGGDATTVDAESAPPCCGAGDAATEDAADAAPS